MIDRPTADELLDAVRHFLETELLPSLTDARLRFQTLIAAHTLGIARREFSLEEQQLNAEYRLLGGPEPIPETLPERRAAVGGLNRQLCEAIRGGSYDSAEMLKQLFSVLQTLTEAKLNSIRARGLPG